MWFSSIRKLSHNLGKKESSTMLKIPGTIPMLSSVCIFGSLRKSSAMNKVSSLIHRLSALLPLLSSPTRRDSTTSISLPSRAILRILWLLTTAGTSTWWILPTRVTKRLKLPVWLLPMATSTSYEAQWKQSTCSGSKTASNNILASPISESTPNP